MSPSVDMGHDTGMSSPSFTDLRSTPPDLDDDRSGSSQNGEQWTDPSSLQDEVLPDFHFEPHVLSAIEDEGRYVVPGEYMNSSPFSPADETFDMAHIGDGAGRPASPVTSHMSIDDPDGLAEDLRVTPDRGMGSVPQIPDRDVHALIDNTYLPLDRTSKDRQVIARQPRVRQPRIEKGYHCGFCGMSFDLRSELT
ncbi:MAG: hypothetical protein Q9159_007640 [Coniocarpon cinnabarinum]